MKVEELWEKDGGGEGLGMKIEVLKTGCSRRGSGKSLDDVERDPTSRERPSFARRFRTLWDS
jgi:hypothetical protein